MSETTPPRKNATPLHSNSVETTLDQKQPQIHELEAIHETVFLCNAVFSSLDLATSNQLYLMCSAIRVKLHLKIDKFYPFFSQSGLCNPKHEGLVTLQYLATIVHSKIGCNLYPRNSKGIPVVYQNSSGIQNAVRITTERTTVDANKRFRDKHWNFTNSSRIYRWNMALLASCYKQDSFCALAATTIRTG